MAEGKGKGGKMAEGKEGNCLRKGRETHGRKGGKLV